MGKNQQAIPHPNSDPRMQLLFAKQAALRAQQQAFGGIEVPQDVIIECSNGHKYRFKDFSFFVGTEVTTKVSHTTNKYEADSSVTPFLEIWPTARSSTSGTTQQAVPITTSEPIYGFGCPVCHTSLFAICDPSYPGYQVCSKNHFFDPSHQTCPICEIQIEIDALQGQVRALGIALSPPSPLSNSGFPIYYPPPKRPASDTVKSILFIIGCIVLFGFLFKLIFK